jgi:hypothetical protein
VLLVAVLVCLSLVGYAAATTSVCTCRCCDAQSCLDPRQGTFAVTDCSTCTKGLCSSRFDVCHQSDAYISATCVDRGSVWHATVAVSFIVVVVVLLILSLVAHRIPFLKKVLEVRMSSDSEKCTTDILRCLYLRRATPQRIGLWRLCANDTELLVCSELFIPTRRVLQSDSMSYHIGPVGTRNRIPLRPPGPMRM